MASATEPRASAVDSSRPERLRRWVVVAGVLAIVANLSTDGYNQWRSHRIAIEDASRQLSNDARILAAQMEGTLKTVDVLLREVADGHAHGNPASPPSEVNALLAGRVQGLPQLLSLVVSDAHGVELYRSDTADGDPNPTISDRSYFIAQRDNPDLGLFVSEPIVTRAQGRRAIALSRRLADSGGRFAGVVPQPPKGTDTGANILALNQAQIGTGTSSTTPSVSARSSEWRRCTVPAA